MARVYSLIVRKVSFEGTPKVLSTIYFGYTRGSGCTHPGTLDCKTTNRDILANAKVSHASKATLAVAQFCQQHYGNANVNYSFQ